MKPNYNRHIHRGKKMKKKADRKDMKAIKFKESTCITCQAGNIIENLKHTCLSNKQGKELAFHISLSFSIANPMDMRCFASRIEIFL